MRAAPRHPCRSRARGVWRIASATSRTAVTAHAGDAGTRARATALAPTGADGA